MKTSKKKEILGGSNIFFDTTHNYKISNRNTVVAYIFDIKD